jgi:hypothetical protein
MKKLILFPIVSLLYQSVLFAQTGKNTFPEAEAVYSQANSEVVIKEVDGKWIATRKITEELQLATAKSVQMMSRGYIYHSSFNELKNWTAYTYFPKENKKAKVTNVSTNSSRQDYIFYDDSRQTTFDFAGIDVGTTRFIEYDLLHTDLHLLTPHYFNEYFPVLKGELKITFPSHLKLKYLIKGLDAAKVQFTESKKKDKITYTFSITDLPGLQYYADAPRSSYYATHVIFFIEKTQVNGNWVNFLSTPADLYSYNYNFIKNLNKQISPELQHLTDSLTRDANTDLEKTKRIYKWVQSHIKYVAFEDGLEGFIPREANLVHTRNYGDCKDMASILTAMLKQAKVPSYITWIGTRDIPYNYEETPLPIVDNHMICVAEVEGKMIFLDGTDETCLFGRPPYSLQGKEALLAINDKEYKIVKVNVLPKESNIYEDSTFLDIVNNELLGSIKVRLSGYYASTIQGALNNRNEEEKKNYLKSFFNRGSNKIDYTNWSINRTDQNDDIYITAQFKLPGYARKIGDEWLLNLNLFKLYEHQEIDYPKRKSPIELNYLNTSRYTTVLNIPKGFTASYIPKSQDYKNEVWGFSLRYSANATQLTLTQQFDNDWLMIQPNQFEQWNKVLEQLFPHYKQTVVLSKQ